jgi:hypothetical protein
MVDPDKKKNVNIIKRENGEAMAFVEILIGRINFFSQWDGLERPKLNVW